MSRRRASSAGFFTVQHHLVALAFGALVAHARQGKVLGKGRRFRLFLFLEKLVAWYVRCRFSTARDRRAARFPVQLRRRLEILGPTYIKLGQVLALRQDLLPASVTDELKNLLDRLPVVPFDRYLELIEKDTGRPIASMYSWVDPIPTGSASIAQIHRATTLEGDSVILKVVKPGIPRDTGARRAAAAHARRSSCSSSSRATGRRQMIREFVDYTSREVDLRREADNAESFAANFHDLPDVVFPKHLPPVQQQAAVLTMEFLTATSRARRRRSS